MINPASDLLGALTVCNEHRARLAKRLEPSSYYANLSPDVQNKIVYNGWICVCCQEDGNKIRGSVESSNAFLRERALQPGLELGLKLFSGMSGFSVYLILVLLPCKKPELSVARPCHTSECTLFFAAERILAKDYFDHSCHPCG